MNEALFAVFVILSSIFSPGMIADSDGADMDISIEAEITQVEDGNFKIVYYPPESFLGDPQDKNYLSLGNVGDGRVVETIGFNKTYSSGWIWDEKTKNPSLVIKPDYNTTSNSISEFEYSHDGDGYSIFPVPSPTDPKVQYHIPGREMTASNGVAIVGDFDKQTRIIDGQKIVITKPGPVEINLNETYRTIEAGIDYFNSTSDHDTISIWVIEHELYGDGIDGTRRLGGRTYNDEIIVSTSAADRKTTLKTIFLHEYIHTYQTNRNYGSDIRWMKEAYPTYASHRILYEKGFMDHSEFNAYLVKNSRIETTNTSLANSSMASPSQYWRGMILLAWIDKQVKSQTDGNKSLKKIHQGLWKDNRATYSEFQGAIEKSTSKSTTGKLNELNYEVIEPPLALEKENRYPIAPEWIAYLVGGVKLRFHNAILSVAMIGLIIFLGSMHLWNFAKSNRDKPDNPNPK